MVINTLTFKDLFFITLVEGSDSNDSECETGISVASKEALQFLANHVSIFSICGLQYYLKKNTTIT